MFLARTFAAEVGVRGLRSSLIEDSIARRFLMLFEVPTIAYFSGRPSAVVARVPETTRSLARSIAVSRVSDSAEVTSRSPSSKPRTLFGVGTLPLYAGGVWVASQVVTEGAAGVGSAWAAPAGRAMATASTAGAITLKRFSMR